MATCAPLCTARPISSPPRTLIAGLTALGAEGVAPTRPVAPTKSPLEVGQGIRISHPKSVALPARPQVFSGDPSAPYHSPNRISRLLELGLTSKDVFSCHLLYFIRYSNHPKKTKCAMLHVHIHVSLAFQKRPLVKRARRAALLPCSCHRAPGAHLCARVCPRGAVGMDYPPDPVLELALFELSSVNSFTLEDALRLPRTQAARRASRCCIVAEIPSAA